MGSDSVKTSGEGFRLSELADRFGLEVLGSGDYTVNRLVPLDQLAPGALAFVAAGKRPADMPSGDQGALILTPALAEKAAFGGPALLAADPYAAYAVLSRVWAVPFRATGGIHDSAVIDPEATLGARVTVGPHAIIEAGAVIGDDVVVGAGCYLGRSTDIGPRTELRPNVTLCPGTRIGSDCLVQSGTVIGSDGFGYAPVPGGWEKIAQLGRVVIGDRVEIGANCTIDCGSIDNTVIESDVIIDNLVHIAHNVHVGAGSALAGQVGIAGSAKLGARVLAGGQVGIAGHIRIHDDVQLHGQAMVTGNLDEPGVYASGIPAQPARDWRRMVARLKQLGSLAETVRRLARGTDSH